MNYGRIWALGLALAVASTSAVAFQEQPGAGPGANPAPAAKADAEPKNLDLNVPPPAAKPEGTEISIPGLGKLGVLPKMDFGLELLYGVNEQPKQQDADPAAQQVPADTDLTIRGSIKKSF